MSQIIASGRWSKIDPEKERHLGHIYERDGRRAHDKRCDYCGKWMSYDVKNIATWGDNAKIGLNNWPEKIHCGSTHCTDYHVRVMRHEEKVKEQARRAADAMFFKLTKAGLVA